MSRRRRVTLIIGSVVVLCAAVYGLYSLGRWFETRNQHAAVPGDVSAVLDTRATVTWNGATYRQKSNLTTLLLMGVDKSSDAQDAGFRQGGQADFLLLLVMDKSNRTVTQLQIDRDTMTDIVVLGVLGNATGTRKAQICLSHGFGDGGKTSAAYTVQAVENLLLGIAVDRYAAVNLNAMGVLNGALGGVTVTLEDDFSAYDAAMLPGATITLSDAQAEIFLRYRIDVGDGTNESRMRRQRVYMTAATARLRERIEADADYAEELYNALSEILVTDMTKGRMINEANRFAAYDILPTKTLAGEYRIGEDGFMEFHADEDDLTSWVMDTFFESVQ